MGTIPSVSIIVSTYNRPDAVRLVLLALAAQDVNDFEVIIADDGSSLKACEQIKDLQALLPYRLNYVWQEDAGFRLAMIRNKAAIAARGSYLIFLDGDSVPLKSFVKYHKKLAEKGCFVAGNRILLSEDFTARVLQNGIKIHEFSTIDWFFSRWRGWCNRFLPLILLPYFPSFLRKLRAKSWRRVRGANFAVWKKDFLAVNGFDESYHGWGYEDSDFVVRLLHNGIVRKDGNFAVPVLHLWHKSNIDERRQINLQKLEEILQSQRVKAEVGVDQYFITTD